MRNFENTAGALDRVAFGNVLIITQDNGTDRITLKVERQAERISGELDHFALHGVFETVNARDTIGHTDYRAFVTGLCRYVQLFNAFFN